MVKELKCIVHSSHTLSMIFGHLLSGRIIVNTPGISNESHSRSVVPTTKSSRPTQVILIEIPMVLPKNSAHTINKPSITNQHNVVRQRRIKQISWVSMLHESHRRKIHDHLRDQRRPLAKKTIGLQPLIVAQIHSPISRFPSKAITSFGTIASNIIQQRLIETSATLKINRRIK